MTKKKIKKATYKILEPLVYYDMGTYFSGVVGDADITDIVKKILRRINSRIRTKHHRLK